MPADDLPASVPPLPAGRFRFVALDVETANHGRGSICQIGLACVGHDGRITGWGTLIDPQTEDWSCSFVHGITGADVIGAPRFWQVLPLLAPFLAGRALYQHSTFDRSAVNMACASYQLAPPEWDWRDSVPVARKAFPELKGAGGHGLASLKKHLGLRFRHHDAVEDARAAAEVVLAAEARLGRCLSD